MNFFAAHIGTILAVVASFGAIGIVAAVVAFGVPFALIFAKVVGACNAALRFLSTPLGQAVGVIALCALCLFVGDVHRARVDAKIYAAKIETAKRAAAARDADIKARASADVDARLAELQRQADEWQGRATAYEKQLADRGACRVTGDDLKRLLGTFGRPAR
jgi:hypothetical protein